MTTIELPLVVSATEFNDYLSQNKNVTDLRIVDLSEQATFLQHHVPGAVFLPYQSLVRGAAPAPGKLPSTAQLQEIFQYLGLNDNTHFVVYDDEGGGWAGRFIWTLDVIGHQGYSYINGGIHAWRAAGLPCQSGQSENPFRADTPPNIQPDASQLIRVEELIQVLGDRSIDVWDARNPEEYRGVLGNTAKLGHMPDAKNIEWTALMDLQHNYEIRKDAREFLLQCGIDGSRPIVTHCQSHHRSGFTYLVGRHLGFDIRAYDGSWAEWGNHPDTPVEK